MTSTIETYHRISSYSRYEMGGGGLDAGSQPDGFKQYPGLSTIPLPQVMTLPQERLSDLITQVPQPEGGSEIDVNSLSKILILAHSLTAKARYGGTEFYYRSVASAGALYPFELYVACRNVSGLADGLYHHSVGLHSLTLLRSGDLIPSLTGCLATGKEGSPALVFCLTSIFFRSSWKYRERAYRYALLDTGHLAENLVLALRSVRLNFRIFYDFSDRKLNSFLGLDQSREVCLAVACVWGGGGPDVGAGTPLQDPPPNLETASRVSTSEKQYPAITEVHDATCAALIAGTVPSKMLETLGPQLSPGAGVPVVTQWPEVMNYSDAVFKRRSSRNFVPSSLSGDVGGALLEVLTAVRTERAFTDRPGSGSLSIGLVAANVHGLDAGFYLLDTDSRTILLASKGTFANQMAHVCLDQAWLGNCAAHFLFLSNLESLDRTWGPRGYRYAMLTAGRLGQRLYLTATSMRIGCCGIGAFYDKEAAELLGLNDRSALLYLIAVGPLKKWTNLRE